MLQGKALTGAVVAIYVFLLAPLFAVLAVSVSPKEQFAIQWAWPSLRWYVSFFEKGTFFNSLFVISLPVALATATFATIVGGLAAVALRRFPFVGRSAVEAFVMLPLFIPSILFGAALYLFFARFNANGSVVTLLVGHALIGIPYVVRVVTAGLHGIDPAIEDAAVSLGCSRPVAFVKTVLPLIRGSLLSGWVFALIMSFSDVNVALFLSGPSTQTLPLQIFSEIRWGGDPTIAAASTVQILLVGGLLFALQRIFRVRLTFK
jgi:putative spermidine/putrescine transport system permease protein